MKIINLTSTIILLIAILMISCNNIDNKIKHNRINSNINSKYELISIIDKFIDTLEIIPGGYDILNKKKYIKYTKDSSYNVMPIGRLINIEINSYLTNDQYEILKNNLIEYYKCNININNIYICNYGTIIIDCRN